MEFDSQNPGSSSCPLWSVVQTGRYLEEISPGRGVFPSQGKRFYLRMSFAVRLVTTGATPKLVDHLILYCTY